MRVAFSSFNIWLINHIFYQHFLWQMQFISELCNFNFAVLLLLRLIKMQDLELLQFWPPFDVQILRLHIWLIWQNNMVRVPSGMNLAKNVYVWRSNGICKLLSSFSSQPNAEFHLEQIYVLGFCWDYCWWNQTKPPTRFPISVSGSHTVCLNLATQNITCIIW